uniref:Uncharacterized protein n=1 Tax=Cacopsylla melanoneura TaxID=428564 RepID=A0A8D9AY82_9HEMI
MIDVTEKRTNIIDAYDNASEDVQRKYKKHKRFKEVLLDKCLKNTFQMLYLKIQCLSRRYTIQNFMVRKMLGELFSNVFYRHLRKIISISLQNGEIGEDTQGGKRAINT